MLQSGRCYTIDNLAKTIGMSRRTVFRDLKCLKKAGIPCYYDKKKYRYSVKPEIFLPPMNLNREEALSLLLLVKARGCIHLPLRDLPLRASLKIENNLPGETRQFCNTVMQNISVKTEPQREINSLGDSNRFMQLLTALLKRRVVNIRYYLPHQRKSIVTELSPYHLRYNDCMWYVIGKSTFHKSVYAFELNQIKELNMLDKCFIENSNFDVDDYLGRAWSMRSEGRLYHVKLKFLPEVAHKVAEIQWHSTQTVTFEDDGSAIVEFRVDGLNEIIWWILRYGDKVQVLAPKTLKERIVEIARNIIKRDE